MNSAAIPSRWTDGSMNARIRKRYAAERRFRLLGFLAVAISVAFLAFLLITMGTRGFGGFTRTEAKLAIDFPRSDLLIDPAALTGPDAEATVAGSDLEGTLNQAAVQQFGKGGEELFGGGSVRELGKAILADPSILQKRVDLWLPVSSRADVAAKGDGQPEFERLVAKADTRRAFNSTFLTASDATDPSAAGVLGALKGTFLTILVTMALAFPIGVLAALYLEEFAPRNRWTDLIEVSINNLAAVPSIIFGLLGLAVFLNFMHLPRSAPLVGGLTLALMTMPVIVIAGRNAIKSVPPSIRDAALGVGASKMQVVFHHVLPLALPGILTGTIIGMARALGETAPLLMIGMRAFIASPPQGITDPSSVLPVQIFLWSDEVDRAFIEKTSAAIIVLLLFMLLMNGLAIYLRNRFERRW
ncbi:phosphate ABC transporter permease PstA [Sphingomonas rhizophila]|uniref:Phosphate transport system permease protein PstA n=1 Tax=Sphingomonas rhizophila TaxID=2071607 RepID=A0A7G9S9I8_9SPHN|nr:phosphate ABC transporter permease PstA [Sphingomonas rhizophila]QNN64513.1 phosphate ABC transporter permease PstA [Sphingomonas rhizophila]